MKEKQSPIKLSMLRVRCYLNLVLCYRYGRVTCFNTLYMYNRSLPNLTRMPANSSNCQELNLPISVAEVELAIARLNLNKAPGNPTLQILEIQ